MTHEAKVMLFFMGTIEELIVKGYAKSKARISKSGYKAFLELKASGFQPSDEELQGCLYHAAQDPKMKLKMIHHH